MSSRATAFLGIDLGSSELRGGLITTDGRCLALARYPYETVVRPEDGRAEQDADAWWQGLVAVVRELSATVDVEVAGICLDGHGPTLTAVDRQGLPVRAAITWLDQRARGEAAELAARTGLLGWALGVLPAALWLERHEPEVAARAAWYLNSWEALTMRLTGLARTTLAASQAWPRGEDLAALGLPAAKLAPTAASGDVVGGLEPAAAAALGIPAGTPVVAGMVDAFASFHGAAMARPGDALDVGGSAGGFGVYWAEPATARGAFTTPAPLAGLFVVGGAMAATGRAVAWFREQVLVTETSAAELIEEASMVAPGADGLVFLPYLAGERSPIWDPHARGAFVGLTLAHGRSHLTRAILEAAALAIRHVAEPILEAGVRVEAMRVSGAPARSDTWNQLKADITGFPVEVPRVLETAVVGCAILAAAGVGAFPDIPAAIASMTAIDRRLEPDPARADVYSRTYEAYRALYPALAPVLEKLRTRDSVGVS
jgi:xylulokinase